jgi:integrase/recombinase XerD
MSKLQPALDEYLAVHRALGFKLRLPGACCSASSTSPIARVPRTLQPISHWPGRHNRLLRSLLSGPTALGWCVVSRCTAARTDARTTVPPSDLLPHRYQRPDPYIYRDEEIAHLLEAARRLPSAIGLRPHTFATLFGLYVAAGLRANEPLRLDRDDVDLVNGVLTIRDTKFGKSRYVPLHPTTQRALRRYATLSRSMLP